MVSSIIYRTVISVFMLLQEFEFMM